MFLPRAMVKTIYLFSNVFSCLGIYKTWDKNCLQGGKELISDEEFGNPIPFFRNRKLVSIGVLNNLKITTILDIKKMLFKPLIFYVKCMFFLSVVMHIFVLR